MSPLAAVARVVYRLVLVTLVSSALLTLEQQFGIHDALVGVFFVVGMVAALCSEVR